MAMTQLNHVESPDAHWICLRCKKPVSLHTLPRNHLCADLYLGAAPLPNFEELRKNYLRRHRWSRIRSAGIIIGSSLFLWGLIMYLLFTYWPR